MKKKTKTNPKGVLHGECIVFESKIPKDAVLEKAKEGATFMIVAESEVTGNHHVIDLKPGNAVQFFRAGNKRFMRNTVPTEIRCVVAERHTAITLPPGEHEIGIQQEFDYFTQAKRNVQD
jgi:hypothetical protein